MFDIYLKHTNNVESLGFALIDPAEFILSATGSF